MASSEPLVYSVRKMEEKDIPQVVDIWKETGLAEGVHCVDSWFGFDPDGFYVAANDEGFVYGVCSAVNLNQNLSFLGLYAVRNEFQKKGIGLKIWKVAMQHVGERNAGLNSVPEHLHTYRDLAGFSIVTKWQSIVYESNNICPDNLLKSLKSVEVKTIDESILDDVIDYDCKVHGFDRSKIVRLSTNETGSVAVAAKTERGVCGYGSITKNIQGTSLVGPLYADSREVAEILLWHLIQKFPTTLEDGLTIMAIDCNPHAVEVANTLGLKKMMEVPRCYRKNEVAANFNKIYGQHALNFSTF
ncbi:uncharacterized protein [Centruroides vittatus]|uniref:uncharacterized protein n=1 Tax=Centruroides vittatus TaxID=120091 RepID=UPI00350F74EF